MCPEPPHTIRHYRGHSGGFAIVSAIFLLVILTSLGAFMVTFSTAQHATSAQDVIGTRAAQAARAGIEWGSYQVLTPVAAPAAAACTINPLALAGNLAGLTVVVACTASGPFVENGNSITIYNITSTASSGTVGSITYVERQFQATLSR
jgi:MSHA biogenesis protein MshP